MPLAWAYGFLAVVLIASAVADVRSGKIYNALTYPAIAVGLVVHTYLGGLGGGPGQLGLVGSAAGLATGFVPMLAAWLAGGVGGGDAKLMAAVGALTGWQFTLSALFYGLIVTAVLAIIVIVHKRIARRTLGRVWRFIVLAFVFRKPAADPAAADSPRVPMGLAFCIGSGLALVEACVRQPGWLLGM